MKMSDITSNAINTISVNKMEGNQNKKIILTVFFITIVVLIFLSPGCIDGLDQFSAQYKYGTPPSMSLLGGEPGACYCITCGIKNRSLSIRERTIKLLYKNDNYLSSFPSLENETCEQIPCNESVFLDKLKDGNTEVLQEGIGIGTTAYDFNLADVWCANRMKYAVEWTTTTDYRSYPDKIDPNVDRCFLKNDVIPIRLLYSSSSNLNISKVSEYAQNLSQAGPMIIGTEADPNMNNEQDVKYEINAMVGPLNRKYSIGLSLPSDNITNAVKFADDILNKTSFMEADDIDYVLIGVRVTQDKPIGTAFNQVFALSRYIMYKYNKPTIITYMILGDTPEEMQNNIKYFFSNVVTALPSNDIIGASFYSYSSMFDPLTVGRQSSLLSSVNTTHVFGGYCTNYLTTSDNTPLGGAFAVFPNSSGVSCNFAQNLYYLGMISKQNSGTLLTLKTPAPKMFECASCKDVSLGKGYFVRYTTGEKIGLKDKYNSISSSYCNNYSGIDMYAEMNGVPPLVAKAVAYTESSFNHCVVSDVKNTKTTCNHLSGKIPPYAEKQDLEKYAKDAGCTVGIRSPKTGNKLCAYGMFQLIDLPKKFGYNTGHQNFISGCINPDDFNPFNQTQSECVGTKVFADDIRKATEKIKSKNEFGSLDNFARLARLGEWVNTSTGAYKFVPNRQKVYHFIYYYAYHYYLGNEGIINSNLDNVKNYLDYMRNNPPGIDMGGFHLESFACMENTNIPSCGEKESAFYKCMNSTVKNSATSEAKSGGGTYFSNYQQIPYGTINGHPEKNFLVPYQSFIFSLFHCIYNFDKTTGKEMTGEHDYGWNFLGSYYGLLKECGDEYMGCPPDGYLYKLMKNYGVKQNNNGH